MNETSLNTKHVLSNVNNNLRFVRYFIASVVFFILIIIIDGMIYYALSKTKNSKEEYLLKSYQESVFNVLSQDLELIFIPFNKITNKNLPKAFVKNQQRQ